MTAQRRVIVRAPSQDVDEGKRERRRQRIESKLERASDALARWHKKLLRACHAVARNQQQIARLNRQLREIHSARRKTS